LAIHAHCPRPIEACDQAEFDRVFGDAEGVLRDLLTIGIVWVAALAASAATEPPAAAITLTCRCTKSAACSGSRSSFRQAILDGNVLAFDVAGFGKTPAECIQDVRRRSGRQRTE
jgi:hypothetical protein